MSVRVATGEFSVEGYRFLGVGEGVGGASQLCVPDTEVGQRPSDIGAVAAGVGAGQVPVQGDGFLSGWQGVGGASQL